MLDSAEIARRTTHVLGLLFTAFTVVGLVATAGVLLAGAESKVARARVITVASLAVLVWFATPTVAAALLLWLGAVYLAVEAPRPLSAPLVVGLLGVLLVAPVAAISRLDGGHVREFTAFATNMILLRVWGYAWDRWHGRDQRLQFDAFLSSMLFFPTFVNGPVEVPRQMAAAWIPVDRTARGEELRAGAGRILVGVVKLLVVGLGLRPGWTSVLGEMGSASALRLWGVSALLYVWFFLSFSAWTDVAIGLGRLCGHRVPENFAAPWLATDPADFWRRWHTSFGAWLRDYVYIPLGGNRRHKALNVVATFGASAAWHVWGTLKLLGFGYYPIAAWGGFLVWGALHAAGVLASPAIARTVHARGAPALAAARVATFLFAALCWLPFFLPAGVPLADGLGMLLRMLCPWT